MIIMVIVNWMEYLALTEYKRDNYKKTPLIILWQWNDDDTKCYKDHVKQWS